MPNRQRSPMESLEILIEGNERFVKGETHAPVASDLSGLRNGQSPAAIVLTCADSRVQPNAAFDRQLGDLFVVRVAGNVVTPVLLGSMELAAMKFGTPLVVILGHTNCGLIQTALSGEPLPSRHLDRLVKRVMPSVRSVKKSIPEHEHHAHDLVQEVMTENVRRSSEALLKKSQIISGLVESGKVAIVQAYFEIETGRVVFDYNALREAHPELFRSAKVAELEEAVG